MKPNFIIAAGVLAIIGVAILIGFFGDGYGRDAALPTTAIAPAGALVAANMNGGARAQMPGSAFMVPVAQVGNNTNDTPPNYLPAAMQLSEAHWQGMDARILNRELRRKLKYPHGLLGILIDETTLNSSKAGLLAGDIIINVAKARVTTLEEFQKSTRTVKNNNQATMTVLRKSESKENSRFVMRRLTLVLVGDPELGFAQVEGAPMILPGDGRPHSYRGACTNCHNVGVGFELTPDPDLMTLPPPPLAHATVVKGISPHRDRGPCEACHIIKR